MRFISSRYSAAGIMISSLSTLFGLSEVYRIGRDRLDAVRSILYHSSLSISIFTACFYIPPLCAVSSWLFSRYKTNHIFLSYPLHLRHRVPLPLWDMEIFRPPWSTGSPRMAIQSCDLYLSVIAVPFPCPKNTEITGGKYVTMPSSNTQRQHHPASIGTQSPKTIPHATGEISKLFVLALRFGREQPARNDVRAWSTDTNVTGSTTQEKAAPPGSTLLDLGQIKASRLRDSVVIRAIFPSTSGLVAQFLRPQLAAYTKNRKSREKGWLLVEQERVRR